MMEPSNANILAIKYVRAHCGMLLLEAKQAVEAHIAEHGGSYTEASVAVVRAHQRMLDVDAECKRIAAERAAEALRVTAGYTTEELQRMPDQTLSRLHHQIGIVTQQRNARDWEAAELRAALLFVWGRMKLSINGGTATFTHEELKRIGPSKISDESDAMVNQSQIV